MNATNNKLTENEKEFLRAMVRQALESRQRELAHKHINWFTMANYNEGVRLGILFAARSYAKRAMSAYDIKQARQGV